MIKLGNAIVLPADRLNVQAVELVTDAFEAGYTAGNAIGWGTLLDQLRAKENLWKKSAPRKAKILSELIDELIEMEYEDGTTQDD
jgi:hypothetical protein